MTLQLVSRVLASLIENSLVTLSSVKLCDCLSPADADTMVELFGKITDYQLVLLPSPQFLVRLCCSEIAITC